jgi:DHA1 family bicyclomycin/chloramphenicol resistance-like MFS transporter
MAASGRFAGTASSVVGVLQFGMAGLVSVMVSLLHDGTARPMALAIPACGLAASLVWWLAAGGGRRP